MCRFISWILLIELSNCQKYRDRSEEFRRTIRRDRYSKNGGVNGGELFFDSESGKFTKSVRPEASTSWEEKPNNALLQDHVHSKKPKLTKVLKKRIKYRQVPRREYMEKRKNEETLAEPTKLEHKMSDRRPPYHENDNSLYSNKEITEKSENQVTELQNAPGPQFEASSSNKQYQHFKNAQDVLLGSAHQNQLYIQKYYPGYTTPRNKPAYDFTIGMFREGAVQ